jgi:heptosyltransferase-1
LRVYDLRHKEFSRILLIKPSAVGDVVHALPVLVKLRQRYPDARIDWMLTPHIADLVGNHPALSNVVLFQRQAYGRPWESWSKSTSGFSQFMTDLREAHYDLVVDLHGQFRSAFFALVTGAQTRIGFDRPRKSVRLAGRPLPRQAFVHGWTGAREGSWMAYTHRIPIPTLDTHASERYLWLGDMLGFSPGPPDFTIPVPVAAGASVARLLAQNGLAERPLAVLAPGTLWETKHWPAEYFAQVARYFLEKGWSVVLAGSGKDRAVCGKVMAGAPGVLDLAGKTSVSELAALIGRADMCVTNDSGPMHLAAALGAPLVTIFGPTDSLWVGPYGQPGAVLRAGLPCSPCYLRRIKDCPFGHACMKQVTPEQVIRRIEESLDAGGDESIHLPLAASQVSSK